METRPLITEEETSGMSDADYYYNNLSRRMSFSSLLSDSPSTSYNKMNVDSDDERSVSSMVSTSDTIAKSLRNNSKETVAFIEPLGKPSTNNIRLLDDIFDSKKQQQAVMGSSSSGGGGGKMTTTFEQQQQRRDPERRSVSRRGSLLPKSKALLRVIDQADEDTHLGDVEMRREHDTTIQLKHFEGSTSPILESDGVINSSNSNDLPAASWTKLVDTMPLYQCSKLNPEIEITNFQLESISTTHHNYKSIKRKVSEDRFEPYILKRRAVSPSMSLSNSPILNGISSPPVNAAARAQQKPSPGDSFNLQDASGGLSRMSLGE